MLGLVLLLIGWVIAIGLAIIAVLHVTVGDDTKLTLQLGAFTFWLYLPIYPVLIGALIGRQWWLALLAGAVAIAHIVWVLPSISGATPIPKAARTAPHFTMVSANIRYDNPTPDSLLAELERLDPDVLDLQEVTPDWLSRMQRDGLYLRYPYRAIAPGDGPSGTAILSKLPLRDSAMTEVLRDQMVRTTIVVGHRSVRLLAIHPFAPTDYELWKTQHDAITRLAKSEAKRYPDLVLAGDFNSTQYNGWLRQLEDLGLQSAHELRGRGLATTWPNGTRPLPPIQLDHVLVSKTVVPLSIREGTGTGSDHRPVITTLAVL